jgi:hypothetical protein
MDLCLQHFALRFALVGWELPLLPPKRFCGSMDHVFVESRKEDLKQYTGW